MSNLKQAQDNLDENEHYTISVQDVTDANGKVSRGYSVRNKATTVVEYESFNLVECLMFSKDMAKHLDDFSAEKAVDSLH